MSRGGGTEPRWCGDGKEIFYIAPNGMLMAVSYEAKSDFATGARLLSAFRSVECISTTGVPS